MRKKPTKEDLIKYEVGTKVKIVNNDEYGDKSNKEMIITKNSEVYRSMPAYRLDNIKDELYINKDFQKVFTS